MCSAAGLQVSAWRGCPIRTSADHSLLATPRGLSQPSTSFIGCWCQGIHRAPLVARHPDRSIETTSEPAGSCSIFGIHHHHQQRMPSIAFDSSSLLCSCPGASSFIRLIACRRAHRPPGPCSRPQPASLAAPFQGDKNAARPGPPRSNRRGPSPSGWTCQMSCVSLLVLL